MGAVAGAEERFKGAKRECPGPLPFKRTIRPPIPPNSRAFGPAKYVNDLHLMPNDITVTTALPRSAVFSAFSTSAWTKERTARHLLFWLVLLLWMSALAETETDLRNFSALLLLNLLRLPLILVITYGTVHYLFPQYFLRAGWRPFALRFFSAFLVFALLDRLVCGSALSDWATSGTGMKWVFFNWIPILRNTFVLLAITCLMTALKWAKLLLPQGPSSDSIEADQVMPAAGAESEVLTVKSGTEQVFLPLADIIRLEKDENYVVIHSASGRTLVRSSLRQLTEQLPTDQFIRIHRSHLIASSQIARVAASKVLLTDGTTLPVSRTCKKAVSELVEKL